MPARVLFLDNLPQYLQDRLKPLQDDLIQYSTQISGYWSAQPILNSLFAYSEEDYYQWRKSGGVLTLRLEDFVAASLEFIDTLDVEDGLDDGYSMLSEVAQTLNHGYATNEEYLNLLVQEAIALNQPLPIED